MDLMHLVDRLEELVAGAQKMPIGNRAILDRRRLLDIIDQMRIAIPEEVREAQEMVLRRDEITREAEEESRIIVARAQEHAARLIEAHEITEGARRRAEELASHTEQRLEERVQQANADIQARMDQSRGLARQQMEAADDYARELLSRLGRQLEAFVRSVDSGIRQLEPDREPTAGSGLHEPLPADGDDGANFADASEYDDIRSDDRGARAQPEAFDERRQPVPLYRQRAEEPDEFENLLRRQSGGRMPAPSPRPLIDDFANPPLDDDPTTLGSEDDD
ncbi:MAG: hypothetical protein O3B31_07065 [Chloroflexi bacterium]|nr:hypothetical protein [Chloroflexota bacterium]MDA1003094.1 hypothetical protein [Chloroflexota bacterium]MQC27720.1 hypothetical protein [Chloroflexota bacterium]